MVKKNIRLPRFIESATERRGNIFVVSGPSGCGKTTLCRRLLRRRPGIVDSVSATTRPPRANEKKGRDYIFLSKERFKKELARKNFLEHAEVFGHYYGTPKRPVAEALKKGRDVLLCIDVQGAAQVRRVFRRAVFIFILPPSLKELKARLRKRSSESSAQIEKRLKTALIEMRRISRYDYVIINDEIKRAAEELLSIVKAARCQANKRRG